MKEGYLNVNYASRVQNTGYDQQLVQHLLSHMPIPVTNGKVLDLACGKGGFQATFHALGFEYFGADIDRNDPTMQISKVDIGSEVFPYADAQFDVVFFKMGIEHLTLREISHCLAEIKRVLTPNGAAIILTPNWLWMYKVFYNEYTHQTPFTPASMRTAIEMAGLTCVTSQSLIQLPSVWRQPWLTYLCNIASLLHPIASRVKFIRYSKERIVFALATK